jgi:predicted ATPase
VSHPRLDDVLDGALDLDPSEWRAYLDVACAGDAPLRAEVESLLAVHVAHPELLLPSVPPPIALPERIGRYPIRREIARGGMGVVYEAWDDVLERTVALKLLPTRLAGDPPWLRRFEREARHLASMDHPNVANVYTLEEADGVHFLTMELVADPPLRERLERGALSLGSALAVCTQIARALETLHRKDIAHCDLKPDNVLVSEEDHVTVIDFGLARRGESTRGGEPRSEGDARTGTPGYMAPEQIEGRPLDTRVDVWAFGCVAYECLAGLAAFPGDDVQERIAATLEREPAWDRLPEELPSPVDERIRACLRKERDERPRDIGALRRELEEAWTSSNVEAPPPSFHHPHGLPQWANVFVGRTERVDGLAKLLDRTPLLTLIGPGGCGKTRLATLVARRRARAHAGGVRFVDLTATTSDEQARHAIADACDVAVDPVGETIDAIVEGLRDTRTLLVLDNCEHRLPACRDVVDRLRAECPGVTVLATSREAIDVSGEVVHVVAPLRLPEAGVAPGPHELAEVESVALFLARAAEASPEFRLTTDNAAAIASLCRRVDGLPLAIEIAATHAHEPDRLERLGEPDDGDPSEARTVRHVIAWSYDLLSEDERSLFRRLAAFAGGFSPNAATAIGSGGAISASDVLRLVNRLRHKSLVELDVRARPLTGDVRFRLLEPIREFVTSVTTEDERDELGRRHARFFVEFAERGAPQLKGPEQNAWLAAFACEHDNLRAVLDRCAAGDEEPLLGLRLAAALETFWTMRGHGKEADRFTRALLARPGAEAPTTARGHTLNAAALCALNAGDPDRADRLYDEALAVGNAIGDDDVIARSTHNKGGVALNAGRLDDARRWFEEYLAMQRRRGNRSAEVIVLSNLGIVAEREGRLDGAIALYEEALPIARELGNRRMTGVLLNNLGAAAVVQGHYEAARAHLESALEIHRDAEDRWGAATSQNLLGAALGELGHADAAKRHFRESLRTMDELGHADGIATLLTQIGTFAVRWGDADRAATILAAAQALRDRIQTPLAPNHRAEVDGAIAAARSALGDESFGLAWARGSAFGTAEGVAFALA